MVPGRVLIERHKPLRSRLKVTMKYFTLLAFLATVSALTPLKSVITSEKERYIIKLKADTDVSQFTQSFGKSVGSDDLDFKLLHRYENVFKGFAAKLSEGALNQLGLPVDDSYTPIGDGTGITVYVVDTGVLTSHNDFGGRASSFYDKDGGAGTDCNGHGTHCAGIIGGSTWGVAKNVNIASLRVFGCDGRGSESDIIAALDQLILSGSTPAVVSLSFSGSSSTLLDDSVNTLITDGFVVVTAAGNDVSDACGYSPGGNTNGITVGATDEQDARAYFSNFGSCLDLFAPGVDVESAWIGGSGDASYSLSGTSAAVPHVSGAAAILLGLDSSLTPDEVKTALSDRAVMGAVQSPGAGSPNRLVYVGSGDGPNTPPPAQACSYTITTNNSLVTSPNYPANYDNDLMCDYTVVADDGFYVQLAFEDFDVEDGDDCVYDVLNIYNGATATTSNKLASLCGSQHPGLFNSTESAMHLTFHTDSDITATGFSALVTFLEEIIPTFPPATGTCSCQGTCDLEENLINTPNYPAEYGNDEDCSYQFSVPAGYFVNVTFLDFELEASATCSFDKLVIFDGTDNTAPEIAELCGITFPNPVFTTGSDVYMEFTTDGSVTRTGFLAAITATDTVATLPPPTSPGPITPTIPSPDYCDNVYTDPANDEVTSPNWPSNYPSNADCGNTIQAPQGSTITLTFLAFDLEGGSNCPYDTVTIYEGDSVQDPILAGPFCDDLVIPSPVTSTVT
ncbi:putative tolloid-like protein 1 [Apostichopus japonicus]|uniref:Putative tolloid-like protein 1 n=1 Tax=Stichopus japonicus TaxID=307972 RepID=A0A2G8L4E3_STIJA|nr:putative tolloid-like protein 1 [Apostichopus japonicus]